jgi:peptidoglycan/LPS O-acetylase OafA/YrhL
MKRILELDGLRGLAALVVVFYHIHPEYCPWGWAAVDLFFVLSGFLITGIILRDGGDDGFLWTFYVRRGLRIWPIYYLSIAGLTVVGLGSLAALPYYLTYTQQVQRYWGGVPPRWGSMAHTWTLAIEEQFYLIWPALLLLTRRRGVCLLAAAALAMSVCARRAGLHPWLLAARCDGLALGAILAWLHAGRTTWSRWTGALTYVVPSAAVAFLVIWIPWGGPLSLENPPMRSPWAEVLLWSLASFVAVAVVVDGSGTRPLKLLRNPALVYLGSISYGLYLYHAILYSYYYGIESRLHIRSNGPLGTAMFLVLTLAVASASWHLVERPILRYKDRFSYRGAAGAVTRKEALRSPQLGGDS